MYHKNRIYGWYLPLLIILLVMLSLSVGLTAAEKMTVSFIDVGQGDSILVQFPNGSNMLVDAGDPNHGETVVKYLRSRNISKIDILVATHCHTDHIGGMPDVLESYKIVKAWESGYDDGSEPRKQFLQNLKDRGIPYGAPKAGFTQKIGSARIDSLAPVRLITGTERDANNNCLVLRISYGKFSLLLTGDMEAEEIASIVPFPQSTVLKVAHHGSRNGTTAKLLKEVSPQIAVISAATQNDYGYPHTDTLAALNDAKSTLYMTSTNGTVIISTDGNAVSSKVIPVSQISDNRQYIGNVKSKVYHLPSCDSLPQQRNRVHFNSADEAISQGYHKHGGCVR
ncbi:MAG: ComEC/Rec2 family competence protein [Armatimonadota bacterium]